MISFKGTVNAPEFVRDAFACGVRRGLIGVRHRGIVFSFTAHVERALQR